MWQSKQEEAIPLPLWKGSCCGGGVSLNSDEEKAHVLHSCLKSPDFRIFSPAVYLKFLFSYGNIQGKACKSETLILLKAHAGLDTYLAAGERQLWPPLQMLPRKRKIHSHTFKLHICSAEEESKRDVSSV